MDYLNRKTSPLGTSRCVSLIACADLIQRRITLQDQLGVPHPTSAWLRILSLEHIPQTHCPLAGVHIFETLLVQAQPPYGQLAVFFMAPIALTSLNQYLSIWRRCAHLPGASCAAQPPCSRRRTSLFRGAEPQLCLRRRRAAAGVPHPSVPEPRLASLQASLQSRPRFAGRGPKPCGGRVADAAIPAAVFRPVFSG